MSLLFILIMHLVHGAKFLNITPLFLSSNSLAAASYSCPVIVIFPLKICMHLHNHINRILAL